MTRRSSRKPTQLRREETRRLVFDKKTRDRLSVSLWQTEFAWIVRTAKTYPELL